jgi:uncharacterized protein YjbI with pentapeptide repeats
MVGVYMNLMNFCGKNSLSSTASSLISISQFVMFLILISFEVKAQPGEPSSPRIEDNDTIDICSLSEEDREKENVFFNKTLIMSDPNSEECREKIKNLFAGKDLYGANLSGLDLRESGIESVVKFIIVNFTGTKLPSRVFEGKNISGSNLSGLDLRESGIGSTLAFYGVDLKGTTLPPEVFKGKSLKDADLSGLDLRESGIEFANGFEGINFSGTKLPPGVFKRRDLSGANLSGLDLRESGIESARKISNIKLTSDFYFSRPLIFSPDQITVIEQESPWIFVNGTPQGKYLSLSFSRDQFINMIKATSLIGTDLLDKNLHSHLADIYFKNLLKELNDDQIKFMAKINEIKNLNQRIDLETFMNQEDWMRILEDSPCKNLIPEKLKFDEKSLAAIYLTHQFKFKNPNEFLSQLANICFQTCPSITESRTQNFNNRAKLKMPTLRDSAFEVDISEDKILNSIDDFLALVSTQEKNHLRPTFFKYKNQLGIDAGGLRRDFYDHILEVFKNPQKKAQLENFTPETLGRTLAMQVGVEYGIPGFNLDLKEEFYQMLIDESTKIADKNKLIKELQNYFCSETSSEPLKIKHFLSALQNPIQVDEIFDCAPDSEAARALTPDKISDAYNDFFSSIIKSIQGPSLTSVSESTTSLGQNASSKSESEKFAKGFLSIINKEKIAQLMPISATELKKIIEGDPTPDAKIFFEKHLNLDQSSFDLTEKSILKKVLENYFNKLGSQPEKQKIQVAKFLKFVTGSTQIKDDNKVLLDKRDGEKLFEAHTCHHSMDCFKETLRKPEDKLLEILELSIEEGLAAGMLLR